jgi:hypothetical protein
MYPNALNDLLELFFFFFFKKQHFFERGGFFFFFPLSMVIEIEFVS